MKKCLSFILTIISMLFLCFPISSCSAYKVEKGYSHFGRLPSMFIGIRTNQIEYEIEDVTLEIAYGWPEHALDSSSHQGYENYSVLIVVYDWTMFGELPYANPTGRYESYFDKDSLCVLKEIKEDFTNEKYLAFTSGSWMAKVNYNTKETFKIPERIFKNITSARSSIYFGIVLIGYSESKQSYQATYSNHIRMAFEVMDNNRVQIIRE